MTNNTPTFTRLADKTISSVRATYTQRGEEYGDSWATSSYPVLSAVAGELGATVPAEALRAIALAALCDVKTNRFAGGWKEDTAIDLCAYYAALRTAVEECKSIQQNQSRLQEILREQPA